MRELLLHVGQDKTGSSFIQSALANSAEKLKKSGIWYPIDRKVLKSSEGKISSGNGHIFNNSVVNQSENFEFDKILFSSEMFFRRFGNDDFQEQLNKYIEELKIDQVSILLYIRDPLEHFNSSYQQAIKRGGYFGTVEEFSMQYRHTRAVSSFVELCYEKCPNLHIYNYSNVKRELINSFETWLGVDKGFLNVPKIKTVNRSLTLGELEFQRVANELYGKDASILADELCNTLPGIPSEEIHVTNAQQSRVISRIGKFCQVINEIVDKLDNGSMKYNELICKETEQRQLYSFSPEQVNLIAETFLKLNESKR